MNETNVNICSFQFVIHYCIQYDFCTCFFHLKSIRFKKMHFEFAIELYFQKTTQKHVSIKEETKNGFRSQKSCWELCQSNYEGHTSSSRWQFHGESENLLPRRWRTFRAPFEKILTLLKYIIKHAILCFHFLFTEVRYLK